jgi:hypothetical protein
MAPSVVAVAGQEELAMLESGLLSPSEEETQGSWSLHGLVRKHCGPKTEKGRPGEQETESTIHHSTNHFDLEGEVEVSQGEEGKARPAWRPEE